MSFRLPPFSQSITTYSYTLSDFMGFLAKRCRVFLLPGFCYGESLLFTTQHASSQAQCLTSTNSLFTSTLGSRHHVLNIRGNISQLCFSFHSTDTCCTVHPQYSTCTTCVADISKWISYQHKLMIKKQQKTELLFFPVKSSSLHDLFLESLTKPN